MRGSSRADETCIEILVDECPEGIKGSQGWQSTFFKLDLQIIVVMWGKFRGLRLAEHICIVVIFWRNNVQVQWS